ncbi:MAG TPA: hypothetical protein VHX65_03180 [Pirellulales bacterium]|nr:hypothetical protein [Pirellulales bacterium]
MYRRPRRRRRHGVLLLVVLCVLFMFLLLAITYAVVASKERSMTRNEARFERSSDPPNFLLDEIAMVLFRDTNDPHSPFRSWSLLEGIYGNVSFRGTVSGTPTPQAGGQFLQFTPTGLNVNGTSVTFNSTPNYYKGCVLTMLTGQCAGLSTRIVASAGGSSPSVTVMRFQADAGLYDPAANDTFLINGRPYCGMGRGYNTAPANATDPANNAMEMDSTTNNQSWPYALLLNPVGFQGNATYGSDPGGPGGANMDYTAPDYNNCYLGLMLNNTTISQSGILPSFFRPALYNYWNTQVPNLSTNAQLLRKISFRPNMVDHQAFVTNTNPSFAAGNPASQFDVDNLGGGVPDSIWIDPGLPVMTARDGRTYKVLVAPCILDLDGRINVNAHGSVLNFDTNVYPTTQNGATATANGTAAIAGLGSGSLSGANAQPIGQGYGPAEINLNGIFSAAEVKAIIEGTGNWSGRYGGPPATTFSAWPNTTYCRPLELLKLFEYPIVAAQTDNPLTTLTTFMSPPDLKGRRLMVLDPRGQVNFITPGSTPQSSTYWSNEVQSRGTIAEAPYSLRLDRSVPRVGRYVSQVQIDNTFTVGELEPILRQYDADRRTLPQRLYSILTSVQTNANQRNKITTDSWDYPGPSLQAPRGLRSGLAANGYRAYGITDLLNAKFAQNCPTLVGNTVEIAKLLPPEMIAGLRMDINRPFGNGRSDSGGVPDSPGGISSNSPSAPDANPETWNPVEGIYPSSSGFSAAVPLNLTNWNTSINPADPLMSTTRLPVGVKARELMARQLYALMMLFADQQFAGYSTEAGLTAAQQQQLIARRIAQWAINAVSFRDATSIMTPFVYQWDIYQQGYQGWLVDGDPGNTSQGSPNYGVVWGCKPPDAVLTETLAFHDKKIGDTAWDNGANGPHKIADKPPDSGGALGSPNFDQIEIPQGSGFLEINCTRNPNLNPLVTATYEGAAPSDLYSKNAAGQYCLDLGRMAPDGSPVWRIVISQSRIANANDDMLTQSANNPDTTTFEPTTDQTAGAVPWQQMNLFTAAKNVAIERVIWLGQTPPPAATRQNLSPGWQAAAGAQIYYNRSGDVLVAPGSYAVIGPRATTYVGSSGNITTSTAGTPQWGQAPKQSILVSSSVYVADQNGSANGIPNPPSGAYKTGTNAAVGMIVAADPPTAAVWSNSTAMAGQTTVGIGFNISEPLPASGSYYPQPTVLNASTGLYSAYGDLTQKNSGEYFLDQPIEENGSTYATFPLMKDAITKTGTTQNYKTAFLQRLADPTSGYDALRNPYLTVDWMPMDLTVFNGEEVPSNANPQDTPATSPVVYFNTRQRGGSNAQALPTPPTYNIWSPIQSGDSLGVQTPIAASTASPQPNFPYRLQHTLGYLNQAYGPGMIAGLAAGQAVSAQYIGDPQHPFPWIDWNARPYASTMELLNVPASSPDRLLFEFNTPGTTTPTSTNPFTVAGVNAYAPGGAANIRAPFGHLLNFFNSANSSYGAGTSWNLYRIFDYLQVPSRFVGCETYLNPTYFQANGSGGAPTAYFLPPFNYVSNYREPGKLNLNTISDANVLSCLMNGIATPTFAQLCDSRRCDGGATGAVVNPATTLPTYFGNPFRSAAGADLVPIPAMMHANVNATLMRASSSTPDSATAPLFAGNTSVSDWNSATRNSYFAYQGLERLPNNVTTRSNVFGVWLTIGYFEAVPWGSVDAGHPDGYQLGEELGSDTGEVERHRAFYIFDRSIPVGYERGQNHNVNRAIVLRRYIE